MALRESLDDVLQNTTFDDFRIAYQVKGIRPSPKGVRPRKKRESYRAPSAGRRK